MDVECRVTADDYFAFCHYYLRRSRMYRSTFLVSWLLMTAALLAVAARQANLTGWDWRAWSWVAGASVFALIYPSQYRWWNARRLRRMIGERGTEKIAGDVRLILTDQSFTEIGDGTRAEVHWRNIDSIEESGAYTFLFLNPVSAAILPRHGFRDPSDYERVVAFAKERFQHFHA